MDRACKCGRTMPGDSDECLICRTKVDTCDYFEYRSFGIVEDVPYCKLEDKRIISTRKVLWKCDVCNERK